MRAEARDGAGRVDGARRARGRPERGGGARRARGLELHEGDFEGFFEVPWLAYGLGSRYVSPMRPDLKRSLSADRNPLFREPGTLTHFTARRAGRPVGRLTAHLHRAADERSGQRRGFFGFFDCVDDREVAAALHGAAAAWLRERGCDEIAGSFNFTSTQQMGVVTGGFDEDPYTDMMYNPPHVPALLRELGYEAFFPMSTFEFDLERLDPESLVGPEERRWLAAPDVRWTTLRRRGFRRQMEAVRQVLNAAFDRNPLFVPPTEEEILFQAGDLMWVVDERLSPLVRDPAGPAGAVVCIPDLNPFFRSTGSRLRLSTPWHYVRFRRARRRAVIVFCAVRPDLHGRGLNPAMLYRCTRALKDAGYTRLGGTWIGDDNGASLRQAEKLGGRRLHRLHLFRKALP